MLLQDTLRSMSGGKGPRRRSPLNLEDVDFAGVFQRLPPVAEPHSNDLPVVVQFSGNLCDLLARGQSVLLKVGVQHLDGLRREAGAPLALFGRLASDELHQILLAFLVPVLGLGQPLLQHGLQLLSALRGDVQLLKPEDKERNFMYRSSIRREKLDHLQRKLEGRQHLEQNKAQQ